MKKQIKEKLIKFDINHETRKVLYNDYIVAKTKQLIEFGYSTLTCDEVQKEVDNLLAGKKPNNVIGMMIEDDNVRNAD